MTEQMVQLRNDICALLEQQDKAGLAATLKDADEKVLMENRDDMQDLVGKVSDELTQKLTDMDDLLVSTSKQKISRQRLQSKDEEELNSGKISFKLPTPSETIVAVVRSTRELLEKMAQHSTPADWKLSTFLSAASQEQMNKVCADLAQTCNKVLNDEVLYYDPEYDGEGRGAVAKASLTEEGQPEILFGKHFPDEAEGPAMITVIHELTHISALKTKDVAYREDPLLGRLSHMKGPNGSLELSNADSVAHGIYQCALNMGHLRLGLILPLPQADQEIKRPRLSTRQGEVFQAMQPREKSAYLDCRVLAKRLSDIVQDVTVQDNPAKAWLADAAKKIVAMPPTELLDMASGQAVDAAIMKVGRSLAPPPSIEMQQLMIEALTNAKEAAAAHLIPDRMPPKVDVLQQKNPAAQKSSVGASLKKVGGQPSVSNGGQHL